MVPSEGCVERVIAAWIVWVDAGGGGGRAGLHIHARQSLHDGFAGAGTLTLQNTTHRSRLRKSPEADLVRLPMSTAKR